MDSNVSHARNPLHSAQKSGEGFVAMSKCILLALPGPTDHQDHRGVPKCSQAPRETCISWEGDPAKDGGHKKVGLSGRLREHGEWMGRELSATRGF